MRAQQLFLTAIAAFMVGMFFPSATNAQAQQQAARDSAAAPAASLPAVSRPPADTASAHSVRGYAMLARPPIVGTISLDSARERLARALAGNERGVLRATPRQYLQALQRVAPEAELRDISQVPNYIRSLTAVQCPQDTTYPMSRIIAGGPNAAGRLDLSGRWQRRLASGEPCLYDNNLARHILSLACGNVILPRPTGGAVRPAQAPAVSAETPRAVAAAPQAQQAPAALAAAPAPRAQAQRPPDTVFVREAPLAQPAMVFPQTTLIRPLAPPPSREPTVIVIRERRSWAAPVLVTTALAAVTYFIVRANQRDRGPVLGPVNPPN